MNKPKQGKLSSGKASSNVREGRRGEVVSVMAALHNFSEREQKESEGKWKASKEGACWLKR